MILHFHDRFVKRIKKMSARERYRLNERLALFSADAFHPLLRNHKLIGQYIDHRSIDIAGDLLAFYREVGDSEVLFAYIGTHHELYGK